MSWTPIVRREIMREKKKERMILAGVGAENEKYIFTISPVGRLFRFE